MNYDSTPSDIITQKSIDFVKQQIKLKNDYDKPYLYNNKEYNKVITDRDHFPYTRYYRGNKNSTKVGVYEREAGYRKVSPLKVKYIENPVNKNTVPNVCFQNPCTTTIPCYVDPEEPVLYKQLNISP